MKCKGIIFACCVLLLNQSIPMSISLRELGGYPLHIKLSEDTKKGGYSWENSGKFEGDMILDRKQRLGIIRNAASEDLLRNGMTNLSSRWPNSKVIYMIKKDCFTPKQKGAIERAMEYIEQNSCLRFRKYKKGDKSKLTISGKAAACFSTIGFKQKRSHMNLFAGNRVGEGCFRHGTIVHELLHIVGFFHMHSNPDRDEFINVHWENIIPTRRKMFMKYSSHDVTDFGVPYDIQSIMHYSRTAFSANGADTISPLQPTRANIGQRERMTPSDIKRLNMMYCMNEH